jgi:predicted SAM-dependent methyltransferase
MKLNFGCGSNLLPGWRNTDINRPNAEDRVDITQPLPFADECAEFVFSEHCVEHVSPAQAWTFFKEVRRILKPGGVFRIAVPSIERVLLLGDNTYCADLRRLGFGDGSKESAVANLICNHGHQALWSHDLLCCCFEALGLSPEECKVGQSKHPELRDVEGHGKAIGDRNNLIETIVVEATK